MVTYEEQLARIAQTESFVATSNDTSIATQNELYRNLYDSCLSDSRCNLDIYVAENNLDPDKLDASITDPIKYYTLRETLAAREVLLDAGYHLENFDAQTAQETGDFGITFNPEKNQPNLSDTTVNYIGISDALAKLNLTTTSTSTVQNYSNNSDQVPENQSESVGNNTNDLLKIGAVGVAVAIVAAVAIKGTKRK